MEHLPAAFGLVFDPYVLFVIFTAAIFGLFVGAIPGLTATMATALLIPITFFMDPVPAIGAVISCSAMAVFAGDIPAALLRMPGTPSSAAYTDEAYAMTRTGRGELALGIAVVCSAIGGLMGSVALALSAPVLAELALNFTSLEYFWLACLGLTCSALITTGNPVKGVISLLIGLMVATTGEDIMSGYPRFSFGNPELAAGIDLIPAMIGMFAVSELIRNAATMKSYIRPELGKVGSIFRNLLPTLIRYKVNMVRGWVVGVLVGALPGAGGGMAAWICMALAKKFSREPEKFGTGHPEGMVEATSANNASLGGAWVPALVFGIPGDAITAIVIGVLFMKGLSPGPTIFMHAGDLLYALFVIFFISNIAMVFIGWAAIRISRHVITVPREILVPVILLFCIVGSFAINSSMLGVSVMLVLGLVAYFMEENEIPVAPAILGIVLGRMVEENFFNSLAKGRGDPTVFFDRPISAVLGAITLTIWLLPLILRFVKSMQTRRAQAG
ncbi:MAG: tripartite tricarboxylate transporter permease [Alphaproteobacteria bacterium]